MKDTRNRSAALKTLRAKRKAQGLCVKCGLHAVKQFQMCLKCRARVAENKARRTAIKSGKVAA